MEVVSKRVHFRGQEPSRKRRTKIKNSDRQQMMLCGHLMSESDTK
jgi:hypothetical protein